MGLKNWLLDKKIKKLLKGLESPALETQKKSALALLEMKDQIINEMIDSFNKLNITGKRNLVVVMGKTDDERAVDFLISLLKHKDPLLQDKSAQSLIALGKDIVALKLLQAMAGENNEFHKQASKVLDEMSLENIEEEKKIFYYIAKDNYTRCAEIGLTAVGPLIAALEKNKNNLDKKRSIVIALGELKSNKAVPHLVELLADKDKYMRERAIEALGKIGDKNAVKHLTPMLQDKNSWIRKTAAHVLESLRWEPEEDIEKASYYMAKKDYQKCIEIGESSVEGLVNILINSEEYDPVLKKEIINALGAIGSMKSCNALISCLKDEDKSVRNYAIKSIKALGPVASGIILKELNETRENKVKEHLIEILGEIGDEQSTITLIELLQTENEKIKSSVIQALGKIKSREAVNPLIEIILDKSQGKEVRENAVIALGEIEDVRAVIPLSELLVESQYIMSRLKSLTAQALGKIGDERALNTLIEYSSDKTCYASAIEALARIESPEAIDALYKIMTDKEDERIERRIAAVRALEIIGGEEVQAILYATLEENRNEKFRKALIKSLNNMGIPITENKPEKYKKRKLKIRR